MKIRAGFLPTFVSMFPLGSLRVSKLSLPLVLCDTIVLASSFWRESTVIFLRISLGIAGKHVIAGHFCHNLTSTQKGVSSPSRKVLCTKVLPVVKKAEARLGYTYMAFSGADLINFPYNGEAARRIAATAWHSVLASWLMAQSRLAYHCLQIYSHTCNSNVNRGVVMLTSQTAPS